MLQVKTSASARSKGALFVSAIDPMKNIINTGNNGIANQIAFWDSILDVIFKLPVKKMIIRIAELSINS